MAARDLAGSLRRTRSISEGGRAKASDAARRLLPMAVGLLALGGGTLAGWDRTLETFLVSPPPFIRVMLGTAAGLLGLVLVSRAADRVRDGGSPAPLVRSLRMVFLAVAAFAASAGWFLASPLPIIAGLVIAGIDVIETSFLLLVTAVRGDR